MRITLQSAEGRAYTLSLYIPETPAPATGLPLVLALDGADHFAPLASIGRRLAKRPDATRVAPAIIAAIESDPPQQRRYADFTPWGPADAADAPQAPFGAAEAFAAFLSERVLPQIARRAAFDSARIGLIGHSLSGYFALYAATRLPMISTICAISPSLWWNQERLSSALAACNLAARRFFIAVGAREAHPTRRMIERARAITDQLAAAASEARFTILDDEDHASTPLAAAPAALRLLTGQLPHT
ncbi:MAG: alpha/beta hydrolase-fold protein [Terricaulis sp.]|nr:alpha/beta hydrolase-fold protein [Terricaulis sp.]